MYSSCVCISHFRPSAFVLSPSNSRIRDRNRCRRHRFSPGVPRTRIIFLSVRSCRDIELSISVLIPDLHEPCTLRNYSIPPPPAHPLRPTTLPPSRCIHIWSRKRNRRVEWMPTRGARGPARKAELILVVFIYTHTLGCDLRLGLLARDHAEYRITPRVRLHTFTVFA